MPPLPDITPDAMPPETAWRRRAPILAASVVGLAALFFAAGAGGPHGAGFGLVTVIGRLVECGSLAALYGAAAMGAGRLAARLWRDVEPGAGVAIQSVVGLSVMLWLSHGLGVLGVLGGRAGGWVALGVLVAAALPALAQFVGVMRHGRGGRGGIELRASWALVPAAVALAVLAVAVALPPGALWESEFGGYDALSYHLALPREWLAQGRLTPLPHNVYSYLPGYVEGAYLHLGAVASALGGGSDGLIDGEGRGGYACQALHALMTLQAAWVAGAAGGAAARRAGLEAARVRVASGAAGGLVLATPWAVVTGSLAYNDMGVVALLGGGLLVLLAPRRPDAPPSGARTGLLLGLLCGAACSVKPTAILFVAPVFALGLALDVPRRAWVAAAAAGAAAGLVMLAPWLVRNFGAGGNPVFPFGAGLFPNGAGGTGAWTAEQVARYGAAHRFEGTLADRLRLVVLPDRGDPAGPRHRGMLHPQWGVFFPVALLAGVGAMGGLRRAGARVRVLLLGSLAVQLGAWLFATHVQSRFLLPMLAPGAILAGLELAGLAWGRAGWVGALAAIGVQAGITADTFARQREGRPVSLLIVGADAFTGETFTREEVARIAPGASPVLFVNLSVARQDGVYLLGDATPFYYRGRTLYNSTWDAWPIAEAMAKHPGEPRAWTEDLRNRGVSFAMVNLAEVDRLCRSRFADPRVSAESVRDWMTGHTALVRAWPEQGVYLVALREPSRAMPGGAP